MKKLLLPLVLLLSSMMLFATAINNNKETSFKIRGYKVNPDIDYGKIIITSAVGHFDNIEEEVSGEININDSLSNYLYNSAIIENDIAQLIFSVRVVGTNISKYTLDIQCEPFILVSERGSATNSEMKASDISALFNRKSTAVIDAYYKVGTTRFIYMDDSTKPSVDEFINVLNESVSFSDGSTSNNKLSLNWTIKDHSSGSFKPAWMARASVLLAVSASDYKTAANGKYTSYVKVILKEGT